MKISGLKEEAKGIVEVARLMLLAARTAPKGRGVDDIETIILTETDKNAVAKEMQAMSKTLGEHWIRDAKNVEQAPVLILIGLKKATTTGTNCGACGYDACTELQKISLKEGHFFAGPNCLLKALDLGIALGSAVKTAQIHNVDNRIFFRAGAAAKRLHLLPNCSIIIGIPLSATGKSIFFDR